MTLLHAVVKAALKTGAARGRAARVRARRAWRQGRRLVTARLAPQGWPWRAPPRITCLVPAAPLPRAGAEPRS